MKKWWRHTETFPSKTQSCHIIHTVTTVRELNVKIGKVVPVFSLWARGYFFFLNLPNENVLTEFRRLRLFSTTSTICIG